LSKNTKIKHDRRCLPPDRIGPRHENGLLPKNVNTLFGFLVFLVVCDYFAASSINFSIVHVSVASFKPTAGVQPKVECTLQKL
jgi:hypothetical protein